MMHQRLLAAVCFQHMLRGGDEVDGSDSVREILLCSNGHIAYGMGLGHAQRGAAQANTVLSSAVYC